MAGKIKLYGPTGYTELAADVDASDNVLTLPSTGTTLATEEFVNVGYRYVQAIYYTSNGTFTKATYPWLRAIRVKVQAGGGGGGGAATTGANQVAGGVSGGGGAYAESFLTDISGLSASVTVTRGAGGSGGSAGNNNGANGGVSSFGTLVSANGGNFGVGGPAGAIPYNAAFASPQTVGTGDLVIGGSGVNGLLINSAAFPNNDGGGDSHLGTGGTAIFTSSGNNGPSGTLGGGGTGALNGQNQSTARSGGNGGNGLVIVELYA